MLREFLVNHFQCVFISVCIGQLCKKKVEDKAPLLYEDYDWLEVKHRMDA
jgi:hypothetical protein